MIFKAAPLFAVASLAFSVGVSAQSAAPNFPNKPITLVVSQAAGSATDIMARVLGQKLGEALGTSVIIDNKPGAGGLLGTELVAKAPADGYTLMIASVSTHGVNPVLYKTKKYDAIKDFSPIGMTAITANVIAVPPNSPYKTLKDLLADAKAKPGKISYGSSGNGSSQHLASEYLKSQAGGVFMLHVPYRGATPGLTALMSSEIDWMMPAVPSSMQFVKNGKLRALAVTSAKRQPELPDVPAVAETIPGFEVNTWYGLVGPAGLSPAVVKRLNDGVAKALSDKAVRDKLATSGLAVQTSTPEELTAYMRAELTRWAKVAEFSKITLD
ncbi:MAG: tripartite tricarboxylate transporter substrate binding protein [Burkholderiales bacterium]|nr:MAG: tripartite tricarboxylate transporter substrate binding protein [Burkholderiales bacterium]